MFGSKTKKIATERWWLEMHLVRWRRGLELCKCRRSTAPPNYGSVPMIIIIMPNEHVSLFHSLRNKFSWFRLPYDSLVKRPRPSMLCYLPSCCNAKHSKAQLFLLLVSIRFLLWNSFSVFLHWSCSALGQRSAVANIGIGAHCSFFTCISGSGHMWHVAFSARQTQVRSITRNRTNHCYFIFYHCCMFYDARAALFSHFFENS